MYRATGILHRVERLDGEAAAHSLLHFLQERWKGVWSRACSTWST